MKRFLHIIAAASSLIALIAIVFIASPAAHAEAAGSWFDSGTTLVGSIASSLFEIVLIPAAAGIMYLGGMLMDASINFALHTGYIFDFSPAINLGWTIVRDLINICFIFILI